LEGSIELKNNFNKRIKLKRMRVKLKKKQNICLNDEIEKKQTSTKVSKIKLEIQKYND
jgi:hypothetical protein